MQKLAWVLFPSLAHLNLGVAPPEPPDITHEAHFSVRQDFLRQVMKKRGGIAREEGHVAWRGDKNGVKSQRFYPVG